ncbi:MAG TPA: YetF domain-containing protein [Roseiflexaceae bacterium]|nr:YetF domain-containing protein [Roseiflexaceae bacterium]
MSQLLSNQTLGDMFALSLPIIEKIVRPWLVYLFLLIGLRLAGKRELAQVSTFDLIVVLMISNTVQNAIIGDDNTVTGGVIGAASLLLLNAAIVRISYHYPKLDLLLEGKPTKLIEDGQLLQANLRRELVTKDELKSAAHKQGFRDLDEVDRAVLETSGEIAVIGKDPSPHEQRQEEILRRLDQISRQLEALGGRGGEVK